MHPGRVSSVPGHGKPLIGGKQILTRAHETGAHLGAPNSLSTPTETTIERC